MFSLVLGAFTTQIPKMCNTWVSVMLGHEEETR